ncbi:MAG: hypothetical protein IJG33_03160 [Selenomonadaceae bacterium]|nr:hypothetical protein [Selenomonadaceae bacterium]
MKTFVVFYMPQVLKRGGAQCIDNCSCSGCVHASTKAVALKRAKDLAQQASKFIPFFRDCTIEVETLTLKKAKAIYAEFHGKGLLEHDWMCTLCDYAASVLYEACII